jgi:acyl-CoA thioesterase
MALTPEEIFHRMFDNDPFSRWMGMELVSIGAGSCTLRMVVRPEMTNGFGVAHGGIAFSLADSAFAFACNSHGRHAVSVHCSIEHVAPVRAGEELLAIATEDSVSYHLSQYSIRVQRPDGTPVAFFRGIAYRKSREWE